MKIAGLESNLLAVLCHCTAKRLIQQWHHPNLQENDIMEANIRLGEFQQKTRRLENTLQVNCMPKFIEFLHARKGNDAHVVNKPTNKL